MSGLRKARRRPASPRCSRSTARRRPRCSCSPVRRDRGLRRAGIVAGTMGLHRGDAGRVAARLSLVPLMLTGAYHEPRNLALGSSTRQRPAPPRRGATTSPAGCRGTTSARSSSARRRRAADAVRPGSVSRSPADLVGVSMTAPAPIRTLAPMTLPRRAPIPAATDPADYALGRSEAEAQRLQLQHHIYGAATRQLLRRRRDRPAACGCSTSAAVPATSPCSPPTSSARRARSSAWSSRPSRSPSPSSASPAPGWRTCASSRPTCATSRLDEAPFDAVVGRWVLMYQPDPGACCAGWPSVAAPARVVAFQESDLVACTSAGRPRRCTTSCRR